MAPSATDDGHGSHGASASSCGSEGDWQQVEDEYLRVGLEAAAAEQPQTIKAATPKDAANPKEAKKRPKAAATSRGTQAAKAALPKGKTPPRAPRASATNKAAGGVKKERRPPKTRVKEKQATHLINIDASDDEEAETRQAAAHRVAPKEEQITEQPATPPAPPALMKNEAEAPPGTGANSHPTDAAGSRRTATPEELQEQLNEMNEAVCIDEARDEPRPSSALQRRDRSRQRPAQADLSPELVSTIVATVLAHIPPASSRRVGSRSHTHSRNLDEDHERTRSPRSRRRRSPRRRALRLRSRTRSPTRSPTPRRLRRPKRSGTPPDAAARRSDAKARADQSETPPWRKAADEAAAAPRPGRWVHGPPPTPRPWATHTQADTASRAVVKFLRHTKAGPEGWFSAQVVLEAAPEVPDEGALIWLVEKSLSVAHGPRLQSRGRAGHALQLRATPRCGAGANAWARGARLGIDGSKAREPRSDEALARRNEAAASRLRRN